MTNKELSRLSRMELLELLIAEIKRTKMLERELQQLREQLEDRSLCIERAGTMAEAAIQLNKLFEAADAAAEQYVENVRRRSEMTKVESIRMMEQTRRSCESMLQEARAEAESILSQAKGQAGR